MERISLADLGTTLPPTFLVTLPCMEPHLASRALMAFLRETALGDLLRDRLRDMSTGLTCSNIFFYAASCQLGRA